MCAIIWGQMKGNHLAWFFIELQLTLIQHDATGVQGCKSTWLQGLQTDQDWPLAAAKSKGRDMSGDETRREFISMMPTLERQQTTVPKTVFKVLKLLQGPCVAQLAG